MLGMAMSAKNASAVPQPTPGVDAEVIHPLLTSMSIVAPPNEYRIPATKPTSAIKPASSFAEESTPIFLDLATIRSLSSVSSILFDSAIH